MGCSSLSNLSINSCYTVIIRFLRKVNIIIGSRTLLEIKSLIYAKWNFFSFLLPRETRKLGYLIEIILIKTFCHHQLDESIFKNKVLLFYHKKFSWWALKNSYRFLMLWKIIFRIVQILLLLDWGRVRSGWENFLWFTGFLVQKNSKGSRKLFNPKFPWKTAKIPREFREFPENLRKSVNVTNCVFISNMHLMKNITQIYKYAIFIIFNIIFQGLNSFIVILALLVNTLLREFNGNLDYCL